MIAKTIIQALKPFQLVSLTLTYLMGAGLVQYVRGMRSLPMLIEGLVFMLLVVISTELVMLSERLKDHNHWLDGVKERHIRQIRWIILFITATFLTVATTLVVGWMMRGILWQGLTFLLVAVIVSCIGYFLSQVVESIQSLQLFLETIIYLMLPPALAFFLQSSDLHPFLTMTMICLIPAYVAYRLLVQIRYFGLDQKKGNKTIVVQVGWEKSMVFHNASILLTYLLFALIALLGFPWFLIWPVFLTLPIGLVEMWLMERTRQGRKPLWRVMHIATVLVFFFPIYLIGFAFWIR
ncbi:MAG: hypothetical protein U9R53_11445 [Chloroflexota bacterium]|nr:hypothetical protein [Chloroflexota bacterium]